MRRKKLQPPQCGCTVFCSFVKIFLIFDFVVMTWTIPRRLAYVSLCTVFTFDAQMQLFVWIEREHRQGWVSDAALDFLATRYSAKQLQYGRT